MHSTPIHPSGILSALFAAALGSSAAMAQPLDDRWVMDPEASSLTFQSVKNNSTVETSSFATFDGTIDLDGSAKVTVQLESVDTGIDLRNVRMRFLFFETFKFPEAVITAEIGEDTVDALREKRRVTMPMPFSLDLHGVTKGMETNVIATLITEEMVSVASASPISIATKDFDLDEGVAKLQDAAKVEIVPSGSVSFDFVFRKQVEDGEPVVTAAADTAPATAALEPEGNLDTTACVGRFEILSRTGAIYFKSGSAEIDEESRPLLVTVADIVQRCPDLEIIVAGHTDSAGDAGFNQTLSERRAGSVSTWLLNNGIDPNRIRSVGYGETRPVAPNDTARNRGLNRRIEFLPADG